MMENISDYDLLSNTRYDISFMNETMNVNFSTTLTPAVNWNLTVTEYEMTSEEELEWNLTLQKWRYTFQRVLVPVLSLIGVVGNAITIAVLTRRTMQSSTYFYLTALAVSDLLYLSFVFSLSFKHIPGMADRSRWLYWEYFRFAYWLSDATSSTSTWLTVAFTIERYIAVCHPMKRKIFCTKTRAKRIIIAVYILCFVSTVTTPHEWIVSPNPKTKNETLILDYSSLGANATYKKAFYWYSAIVFILIPLIILTVFNSFLILALKRSRIERNHLTQSSKLKTTSTPFESRSRDPPTFRQYNQENKHLKKASAMHIEVEGHHHHQGDSSDDGKGTGAVFAAFPRYQNSQKAIRETTQENKVTQMLIAVVLLAILCQMPTALTLIYTSFTEVETGTPKFFVLRILGNVFNFLTSVNAASNFILYCVMSDRFRKTFIQMFCKQGPSQRNFHTSFRALSYESSQGRSGRISMTSTSIGNRSHHQPEFHHKLRTFFVGCQMSQDR